MSDSLEREFENCKLEAYLDELANPPVWTIGWGHTGKDVYPGLVWTQEQADEALDHDIQQTQALIAVYSPGLAGNTLDAITDFVFNLGIGRYRTSTLCKCVNAKDWDGARQQIVLWDHSNGKVVPGLLRRRQAEEALI